MNLVVNTYTFGRGLRWAKSGTLAAAWVLLSACSSDDGGGEDITDEPQNDRYAFASRDGVNVSAAQGVLANDGSAFESAELVSDVNAASTLDFRTDGSFSYTPGAGIENDAFTYRAIRSDGDSSTVNVSIAVLNAVAGCSEIDVTAAQSAVLNFAPSGAQADDGLTYNIVGQPTKGSVSGLDRETGQATYLFSGGARGSDSVTLRISDRYGTSADLEYQLALTPVRIMPLGNSLTEGIESDSDPSGNPDLDSPTLSQRVGYRKALFDSLNNAGYSFDFVGSRSNAGFNVLSDFQHQGHPGYTDYEISGQADPDGSNSDQFNASTDGVYNWLTQNNADVILLHAGTNNIINRTTADGMKRILDEIDRWENANGSEVTTLVAKIIDKQRNDSDHDKVIAYNANVQSLVNTRIGQGDNLVLVDIYNAVGSSLLDPTDKTHLTPAGYSAMASAWLNSINASAAVARCN